MKTIRDWNDLRAFGINQLTGEACAYSMRRLYDVDEKAVRELFGLPPDISLARNWNGGSTGCVMIPYSLFTQLAAFVLLHDGACEVLVRSDEVIEGWYPDDEDAGDDNSAYTRHIANLRSAGLVERTYRPMGGPRVGSRMTHGFTGRTA